MKIPHAAASTPSNKTAVEHSTRATSAPPILRSVLTAANSTSWSQMDWLIPWSCSQSMATIIKRTKSSATRREILQNRNRNIWINRRREIIAWIQNWSQKWTNSISPSSIRRMSQVLLGFIREVESLRRLEWLDPPREAKFHGMEQLISAVNSKLIQVESSSSRRN